MNCQENQNYRKPELWVFWWKKIGIIKMLQILDTYVCMIYSELPKLNTSGVVSCSLARQVYS